MNRNWTRRQLLHGTLGALAAACAPARDERPANVPRSGPRSLAEIEETVGGRVGVFALDTGTGRQLAHRPDERFAMCSTFKWVLAAAVLARVDRGELSLDDRVAYGSDDLLDHAPVTRARVTDGTMTVEALAQAAVTVSDNTAANLLLAKTGGPTGLTAFVRQHADTVTRLDRDEPTLNDNTPQDPRDTTSPRAMALLMRELLCGDALSAASRERLLGWMRTSDTGRDRLRAGLPAGWSAGDKTGTGQRGSVNDVAIAWPPGRAPVLVAAYLSDSDAALPSLAGAHAEIGRLVAQQL
ncbi:MAG: class A beta-lactamase [Labilithrix sp.]|nr:class A beta-lactamase [Labilithrix sp.]MBX3212435.1 class A beta-lactamase [Labilithrix sp.]